MTTTSSTLNVLAVEPNQQLTTPYNLFPKDQYHLIRVSSIKRGLSELTKQKPNLVLLSASLAPSQSLIFLEALKNSLAQELIPLIIVVDLNQPLSTLAGTFWGDKLGIIHPLTSPRELAALLIRLNLT